jgi:hypothetical protein
MANTYTEIVDKIFARGVVALRQNAITSRLINTDWGTEVAEQGDTIDVSIPSAVTVGDVTPGPTPPAGGDSAPTKVQITLDKWKKSDMHVTDKEAREIALGARELQLSEHLKALANQVDNDVLALYKGVYGYAGTAGTTPFATSLAEAIAADKVLNDQLAPIDPRRMLLGTAAKANALANRAIQDASFRRSGPDSLASGDIGEILGFLWAMNQNIPTHTKGAAGTVLLDDSAARAVGIKTLHMDGLTTKPSVGDVFTIAGDSQTYTVTAATDLVGTDSDVSFEPGLAVAIPAADGNEAVTFKATHVVNLAFHRDAFALATRTLAPADGFVGGNIIRTAVEPVSGLTLTLEVSREYARTKYQWRILYGVKLVRPQLACRVAG